MSVSNQCTLAWMLVGTEPKEEDFKPTTDRIFTPEIWQQLVEAIPFSYLNAPSGMVPWIKVGDKVLKPDDIVKIFYALYPGIGHTNES